MQEKGESHESGSLTLSGGMIRYCSEGYGSWELRVDEVRIVGEFTNQNGPFADDWFLAFVTADGSWREASRCADEDAPYRRDAFRQALEAHFEGVAEAGLFASADFASAVLWPPELRGRDLFVFARRPGRSARERLAGLASLEVEQCLTDEVREWLAAHG